VDRRFVPGLNAPANVAPNALCFAVQREQLLVVESGPTAAIPRMDELDGVFTRGHYLGSLGGIDCFAVALEPETKAPDGMAFHPLRPLHARLPNDLFSVAGRALQIAAWDDTHRYCGRCASPTEDVPSERAKRCPACGLLAFPRVSPAVIVRVLRGQTILLAHGRGFPQTMYSILAGFVEPGESLEDAVAREVREEVGLELIDIRYFGSQPWPFPHSLMVGFTAEWADGEITIDDDELVHADWFAADALPQLPPQFSIARRLIDDWLRRGS
jgi:NAD+ diphosphatase